MLRANPARLIDSPLSCASPACIDWSLRRSARDWRRRSRESGDVRWEAPSWAALRRPRSCSSWSTRAGCGRLALEEIEVTGSRIAQRDFTSASPIVSVPAELFAETAAVSVERTLAMLPQFVPTVTGTSNYRQ